jgi:hypothetical protein
MCPFFFPGAALRGQDANVARWLFTSRVASFPHTAARRTMSEMRMPARVVGNVHQRTLPPARAQYRGAR